jgi:histidinol-phosphate aminotransferase
MITAKKHLFAIRPYKPGKPIEEVKRQLGLPKVIKLASNEIPFPPSPRVIQAISREAKNINRYPDDDCFYLRREIARRLKIAPEQLIFGGGSDEIIYMTAQTFLGVGDEVVIAKPSFLMYTIAPLIQGARIKAVMLKGLNYDLDGMTRAVTRKTKVIFLGNPDNPAGTFIPKKALEKFLKAIAQNIVVLIDEAYLQFVEARDYPNSLQLLKSYPNIIIARTFSKLYGLAGLRIGYGVARPEMIQLINRVREPFNVNSLAQAAALACLKDEAYYRRVVRDINVQKQFLYQGFRKLGLTYYKSATNFILLEFKIPSARIIQNLLQQGIIVRDMKDWGLQSMIRVTIGTKRENQKLLAVLKKIGR